MALIRLCYAADLPTPADAMKALQNGGGAPAPAPRPPAVAPAACGAARWRRGRPAGRRAAGDARSARRSRCRRQPAQAEELHRGRGAVREQREARLVHALMHHVHEVRCEPGLIEFRPEPEAPATSRRASASCLGQWTGRRWIASVSSDAGRPTSAQQKAAKPTTLRSHGREHPLVQAILKTFPGATLEAVRRKGDAASLVAGLARRRRGGAAAGRGISRRRRDPGKRVLMFDKLKDLGGLMKQAQADAAEDAGAAGQARAPWRSSAAPAPAWSR